jgi:hypothetical protein
MTHTATSGAAVPDRPAMVRQGDVLLIPDEHPEGSRRVRPAPRLILAEGEATGHAHAIRSRAGSQHPDAYLLERDTDRWLVAEREVTLEHEEHAAIAVAPGVYRVVIQREYVPPRLRAPRATLAWRRVAD